MTLKNNKTRRVYEENRRTNIDEQRQRPSQEDNDDERERKDN